MTILIVSIVVVSLGIGIFTTEPEIEIISNEKIVLDKNFQESEMQKIKTDEEIMKEIDDNYNKIEQKLNEQEFVPREWQKSGPFSIDRKEYRLGEKIFVIVEGLKINEKGQISVLRQTNQTHYTVWETYNFDGNIRESFNIYFEPKLLKPKNICEKDDLLGNWVMVFQGTNYEKLKFKIIDNIILGDEEKFNNPVC